MTTAHLALYYHFMHPNRRVDPQNIAHADFRCQTCSPRLAALPAVDRLVSFKQLQGPFRSTGFSCQAPTKLGNIWCVLICCAGRRTCTKPAWVSHDSNLKKVLRTQEGTFLTAMAMASSALYMPYFQRYRRELWCLKNML